MAGSTLTSWTWARQPRPISPSARGNGWAGRRSLLLKAWRSCPPMASTTSSTSTFREGWDQAQPGPAVVLTQGRGGAPASIPHYADRQLRDLSDSRALPVTFGAPGASLGGSAFRVHLLDYNATTREVRIRVRRGPGVSPEVVIDWRVDTLGSRGSRHRHHDLEARRSALPDRNLAVREDRALAASRDRSDV